MQGKITKVLNMKPVEILGMIEEAAGTRMYEEKKLKAQKTMEKKEMKLEEIQSVRGCFDFDQKCGTMRKWEFLQWRN